MSVAQGDPIRQGDPTPQGAPLIVLDSVDKHFGPLHVLRDVNLAVDRGEVVVIVGPSGSGKSTLCRVINRLEPIDSGTIRFDGEPLPAEGRALARLRSEVGMVFQSFNLFAHKTVLDNVTLAPIKVRKEKPAAARERALAAARPGGHHRPGRASYPAQLSGGQQQRAAIARALAMQPKAMLFDEPTSALDPEMVGEVLDVMTVAGPRRHDHDRRKPRDGLRPPRGRPGRVHGRRSAGRGGAAGRVLRQPRAATEPRTSCRRS